MTDSDPYLYPGSTILRNKLGIRETARLDHWERELVAQRVSEGIPIGSFDLRHLRSIHRHLFQDIYEWAGEVRTVEIAKGGSQFQFLRYIETGMADVHRRLAGADYLRGIGAAEFAGKAGEIAGDLNYVHPFRDGNGRTQLQYLKQLAEQAGHLLDLTRLDPQRWIEASRAAHNGDYTLMGSEIERAIQR